MSNRWSECRIVFMGTPDFAVPSLEALIQNQYQVVAVVTQPDRPKGRKKVLTPPPVKEAALRHQLPVLQPERVKHHIEEIAKFKPDLIVTAAFGQILPLELLQLPKLGAINVHASLLPKYRGAAPIQYALLNGETETGVTIMYMEEGLDTGDMISSVKLPIDQDDNAGTLFDKLSVAGAELLIDTLPELISGTAQAVPQNEREATYARSLKREDERIDWSRSAEQIVNHVRALSPWPGAFTIQDGQVFKIWAARPVMHASMEYSQTVPIPGEIVKAEDGQLWVQTGEGILELIEVQPAGKKRMPVQAFLQGKGMKRGTRFEGEHE